MAPAPLPSDGGHYDGASPLDGGPSPSTLGGSSTKFKPSAAEIGIIVSVIVIVLGTLAWIFFWRARRARLNRQANENPASPAHGYEQELTDASGLRIPTPLPKDDRASTAEIDDVSSIERPPRSQRRPTVNWSRSESPQVKHEPHEFPSRF
ncbi:hypothetical protein F5Y17DRAFT_311850 [Xylariaceae sp. FL0594]|nr:hypothetical protein F5Y17DRAFT_311850 [Xylariaceae sp. FL0594]